MPLHKGYVCLKTQAVHQVHQKEYFWRYSCFHFAHNNVELSVEDDGDNWIELIQIENPLTVDNETEAHVKIFH